ncbi:PilZ domain-containing protein [Sediminispirochaeta bajacaliforniensis]|uniref:PilZ domain-containing protein n=1 Tax=Sediminispirochaeta bajacaliforniensis TaxID=148 RepID=UPI00035ECD78|nr:PilZ domain-containing protein [Sediminispirochaeta bajacaliforniensis]
MSNPSLLGRKVFFLYPHSVIKDEMIEEIVSEEYEAYVLKDHNRAARLMKAFPGSVLFINIDSTMKEPEWERYILEMKNSDQYNDPRIGIFTYDENQELARKYLIEYSLPAGFIRLKLGFAETKKILLDVLKANEAKGRRKFVRALCAKDAQATINVSRDGSIIQGKLLDISSAGAACAFPQEGLFSPKSYLSDIQLQLRGARIMLNAIVMGTRQDDGRVHVILFDPKSTDGEKRLRIFRYIRGNLQRFIESYPV